MRDLHERTAAMKKHKYNIFPEAKKEDFERLKADIEANGFDKSQPITTYEGEILDGWNRLKACEELTIAPGFAKFSGSASDAIAFVMRTNKRRNLNSGQWATIAAEAEELIAAIAEEAAKNKGGRPKSEDKKPFTKGLNWDTGTEKKPGKIISPVSDSPREAKTAAKVAEVFNTNSTYVKNAVKMKEEAPEVFEKVKAGKMTMQDGMKAVRAIPKDPWSESERKRQGQAEKGIAVVANAHADKNLIAWAEANGKAMRVDRGTKFGNPFILNDDGTRDHVCDCYEHNYLPNKPSIHGSIEAMKGMVLICHCHPLRCHGDSLAAMANGLTETPRAADPKTEAKHLRKLADKLDPPTKFTKPDLEDVSAYMHTLGDAVGRDVSTAADGFMDHYQSNGWMVGKVAMKDWRATARKWLKNQGEFSNGKANSNGRRTSETAAPGSCLGPNGRPKIEHRKINYK